MSTYSPTYRSLAAQFKPLQDRTGTLLGSNPILQGSPDAEVVLANVMAYSGQYYFTGPGVAADKATLVRMATGGAAVLARYNQALPEAQRIYCVGTHEAALAGLWQLVSTHYNVPNAAEQVVEEELRRNTDEHRALEEGLAQQERAAAAFEGMRAAAAAFLASYQTDRRPAAIEQHAAAEQQLLALLPGTAVWVRADEEPEGMVIALVSEAYDRGDIRTAHGVNEWGNFCPVSYSQPQAKAFFKAAEQTLEYACTLD